MSHLKDLLTYHPSGVGKTQFLLILLLSVQLPSPIGLSKSALYISTEAALSTQRLAQMLSTHPQLCDLHDPDKPSLSRILSIQTPDLESQEHILRFQVPVAIERHNIGLLVIDSITANFRAEFDPSAAKTSTGNNNTSRGNPVGAALMQRTAQLQSLGTLLRDLARKYNLAVVVSNQVADRFLPEPNTSTPYLTPGTPGAQRHPPSSHPAASHGNQPQTPMRPKSPLPPSASAPNPSSYPFPSTSIDTPAQTPDYPLTLEHQHRFFTGWGDQSSSPSITGIRHNLKTPSLGLIWTNQIACRIALVKRKARPGAAALTSISLAPGGRDEYKLLNGEAGVGMGASRWQRHFRVVFSAWAAAHALNTTRKCLCHLLAPIPTPASPFNNLYSSLPPGASEIDVSAAAPGRALRFTSAMRQAIWFVQMRPREGVLRLCRMPVMEGEEDWSPQPVKKRCWCSRVSG